jgi:hypothetical protein
LPLLPQFPKLSPATVADVDPDDGPLLKLFVVLTMLAENVNIFVVDPPSSKTVVATFKFDKEPLEVRQVIRVSLYQVVAVHAVAPMRMPPLQSLNPDPIPCNDTKKCAVEGDAAGVMLAMIRRFKTSGNNISCVWI